MLTALGFVAALAGALALLVAAYTDPDRSRERARRSALVAAAALAMMLGGFCLGAASHGDDRPDDRTGHHRPDDDHHDQHDQHDHPRGPHQ